MSTVMRIAELARGRVAGVAASLFELRTANAVPAAAATPRDATATAPDVAVGAARGEILQAAARLKLVLGAQRGVVAVTGIEPADGGSLLTGRLAAAMAHIDHSRVLVVDGNVAAPTLGALFHLPAGPGLLDVLEGHAELKHAIRPVTPDNLFVLPLGTASGSLPSLLTSVSGTSVIGALREHFRYVIVDAGLIRRDPGGILLASLADGVVIALARAERRRDQVVSFQEELQRLTIPLFGVVLTWVSR